MADSELAKSDLTKDETEELNKELTVIRNVASGRLSPLDQDFLMVGVKGGVAGAGAIFLGRYAAKRWAPIRPEGAAEDDANYKYKRMAIQSGVGLASAYALRKVSPVAAVVSAVVAIGDGIANAFESTVEEKLDEWFDTSVHSAGGVYDQMSGRSRRRAV